MIEWIRVLKALRFTRALLWPLTINAMAAAVCAALFGSAVGWNSVTRTGYSPWIGNGLPFLQILAMAFLANRLLHVVTSGTTLPKLGLQLVSVLVYFLAIAVSVSFVFNESLGTLLAASGIAGLVVGFAIRGLLADLFSGIVLHLDSNLTVGDWVDVSLRGKEFRGKVLDIQWRTVVITDRSENLVLIPNSEFVAATVVNRSRPTIATEYGATLAVGSEYDRRRVVAILETALARVTTEGSVLKHPAAYVRVGGLEGGLVLYRMFYSVDPGTTAPLRAQSTVIGTAIDFLKAAGIHLYPIQRTHHCRPTLPGYDRHTEADIRQQTLANVRLLSVLSHDELRLLAEATTLRSFRHGQTVMRAGEAGESMMVVVEGRLEVTTDGLEGPIVVATLWPGECVGEMSLLTGAPRSATVIAAGDVFLFEVDKAALAPILAANQSLVKNIATLIETRHAGNGNSDVSDISGSKPETLLTKIINFFRLLHSQ
ncbi:MAG: mechanosensitive ion channel family protein [Candidatus Competibacteraceae bacterium]